MPIGQAPVLQPAVPFNRDARDSCTLPGHYYYDPAILAQEKEKIFYRNWLFAAHASEVAEPGSYVATTVIDQDIIVARGMDGVLRAFYNVCPHRGASLMDNGVGKRKTFVCPYHNWTFDTDGSLKNANGAELMMNFDPADFLPAGNAGRGVRHPHGVHQHGPGRSLAREHGRLHRRRVPRRGTRLRRPRSGPQGSLRSRRQLEDRDRQLRRVLSLSICAPGVHGIGDVALRDRALEEHGAALLFEPHRLQGAAREPGLWLQSLPGRHGGRLHMGALAQHALHGLAAVEQTSSSSRSIPPGPSRPSNRSTTTSARTPPSEKEEEVIKYHSDVVNEQDIAIIRAVQRGVKSRGYKQGRFVVDDFDSWRSEHGVHHFERMVWEALNGSD